MDVRYGIYRAADTDTDSTSFISDAGVAVVLEIHNIEKETINEVAESLRESLKVNPPGNLEEFQSTITKELALLQNDGALSAACGFVVGEVIYVVVVGGGVVFIKRGDTIQKIVEGSVNASGKVLESDIFIFQTASAAKSVSVELLSETLKNSDLVTAAEEIGKKTHEKPGSACLLSSFAQEPVLAIEVAPTLNEQLQKGEGIPTRVLSNDTLVGESEEHIGTQTRSRKITVFVVVVLLGLLTWSVVFGVSRRESEQAKKNITASTDIINAKLEEAANVAPLNIERATVLIGDAQNEVAALRKKVGEKYEDDVVQLEKRVNNASNKIVNKQNKKFEEFYDLSLIDKTATANHIYLDGEDLTLLNSTKGEIYIVSATKKSNIVIKKNEIKGAHLVSSYEGKTFFLNKDKGIYTVLDGAVKQPIQKEGLQNPKTMIVFNANIYVLDSGAGDVVKYVAGEDVYSKGASYFADSQAGILKGAQDLAIDSSIYVLVDGVVIKYTSGVRDTFKLSLPDKTSPKFTHMFTNQKLDSVYLLDTNAGKMVVVSKSGEYSKQVESSIFKNATKFVVFGDKIIVLSQNKLYSVEL